jgi:ribosome-associated toxin RatA of RatAB toxin-antitoxin module
MTLTRLIVLIVLLAATPAAAAPMALSLEQRGRVERGEVIVLDVLPPGDRADAHQGGTVVALMRTSAEAVWHVLLDFANHAGVYPRVVTTTVLQSDPSRTLVRYVVGVGPFSFGFHVNNYPDDSRRRLVWHLAEDRPNDLFRTSWGYWQLDPDRHGVVVTYAMAARTVLPAFLTRGAERDGLLATIKAVRERAEHAALAPGGSPSAAGAGAAAPAN